MSKVFRYGTTYETFHGDVVVGSMEVKLLYTVTWGSGDVYDKSVGGPGGWSPGWPDEVDLVGVEVEDLMRREGTLWRAATRDEADAVLLWAEGRFDEELLEHARECLACEYEAAMEYRLER